jgi:hypothetical protein
MNFFYIILFTEYIRVGTILIENIKELRAIFRILV